MTYKVTENPSFGKDGKSYETTFEDDIDDVITGVETKLRSYTNSRELGQINFYEIVEETKPIVVNKQPTQIIIQNIQTGSGGDGSLEADISRYDDTAGISNFTTKTLFTNNKLGPRTNETIAIWSSNLSTIYPTAVNQILEIQIRFTTYTDTLGGAFELTLENVATSTILDIQEQDVTIQNQDFTITFKIVTESSDLTQGLRLYIKPELGMTLSLSDIEFLFIVSNVV